MRQFLVHLPRNCKRVVLAINDLILLEVSLLACFYLRLSWGAGEILTTYAHVFWVTPLCVLIFLFQQGVYSSITRHAGVELLGVIARGISYGVLSVVLIFYLVSLDRPFPRSVFLAYWVLAIFALVGARLVAGRWLHGTSISDMAMAFAGWKSRRRSPGRPVVVYGAGASGYQLVGALAQGVRFVPVAFVDDDARLQGEVVGGLKVYAPRSLPDLIGRFDVSEVFLAMPSVSRHRRREIVRFLEPMDVHVRSVPSMEELADGRVRVEDVRDVDVEDILGREPVPPDIGLLASTITGRNILVTGAGGSIGSELCRQILKYAPATLVLLDHSESHLYALYSQLEDMESHRKGCTDLRPVLGSVTDGDLLVRTFMRSQVDCVYHAAAYKHVPLVEANVYQGIVNNICGTLEVAKAALACNLKKMVLVSTDKAVRPTNMMGVSKRLAEMCLQAISAESQVDFAGLGCNGLVATEELLQNSTVFTMVRFGNVLDSSGSVIPRFRQQIRAGGPVTVTHPDITRYFMTIPEAAELVLHATGMSQGGDVFILDMGEPVRIADLARKMIHLSGLTLRDKANPDGDIEIVYTGLRPGEKLHEELLIDACAVPTLHPKIWRANEQFVSWYELKAVLSQLDESLAREDFEAVKKLLARREIGYRPAVSGLVNYRA